MTKITGTITVNTEGQGIYEATVDEENLTPYAAAVLLAERLRQLVPQEAWDTDTSHPLAGI